MIKPDEIEMMRHVLASPSGHYYADSADVPALTSREAYVLGKWADRGWWEYGVSLRGGWLTADGRARFATTVPA